MELSSKAFFTSCQIDPSSMKPTAEVVNTKATGFASTLFTSNWSIPQDLALASTRSSNHLKYLPVGQSNSYDDFCTVHARKLKGFREILLKVSEDKFEALLMVDAIQRLGIDYHFQRQIESILERHALEFDSPGDNDLHEVALRFRLLRQEGLYVPAEVFDKFKDEKGNFRSNPFGDLMGVTSLYEASQLSIRGEDTLDDARDYTYQLLNSSLTNFDHGQTRLVRDTLDHPHHKSLAKFTAKKFFRHLQETNWWTKELKELAMFDFKMVQSQHRQEIAEISRWWKDLGLSKKLPAARDQPLKWYTWSMACLTDPILSEERIELTKPVSFIYIFDDIFDVYGTLDELMLFTQVVNRWDMDAAERLPDYMQICFKALDNITNEIGCRVYNKHGWSPVESFRKAWGRLCSAFLVEAQWFASEQLPKAEEYLKNGIISSGVHVVLVHIFFLLGQGLNKGNAQMVDNNPEIISSTAAILRLWDDLGSAEDEDQDGHDGSYIKYYMNEHPGSALEGARRHVTSLISDAWKQLNQECLSPNPFSPTFTKAALNLARMVPLMYNYDQNHRLPTLEEHVKSLLSYDASEPL